MDTACPAKPEGIQVLIAVSNGLIHTVPSEDNPVDLTNMLFDG